MERVFLFLGLKLESPGNSLPAGNVENSAEVVALDEQAAEGEQRQLRVLPDLQVLQVLGRWVHTLHMFIATWSLLVEKTCWKVASPMSGVIPITSLFKLRQAESKRTRRCSGQGQEMDNCKLVIQPQKNDITDCRFC